MPITFNNKTATDYFCIVQYVSAIIIISLLIILLSAWDFRQVTSYTSHITTENSFCISMCYTSCNLSTVTTSV